MTDSVVVEGYVKFRDGKKWKTRWLVLRKPSPVADCLVLLVYKDKSDKAQGHKERASVTLEDICGLESQWSEGGGYTLAILCLGQAAVLGFDSKEALLAWELRVRYCLGEVHRFSVGVLPGTKLESGPATLHLCNNLLVLARDTPPVIVGQWNLPDLRRYGPVPNGFVFEGGTRCGYWAGVFFLSSAEGEQISFLFDCIVRGVSPSRPPPGLRPVLPEPNASANDWEERVNHEAQELEKRLSMLSHQSSTASTYSPSVAGDDRSISGSSDASDTSQSDCSIGSRLAIWTEPATSPASSQTAGQSGAAAATPGEEKLSVGQGGGACLGAKPPGSRQLQEIGRQSSSDSGIATGSHSSYSGSFSSYAGSLDIGAGEEFGSLLSLPPHLGVDLNPCCCPPAPGHEYQVPTSLRYLYDTPRSLLREGAGGLREPEGQGAPATGSEGEAAGVPPEEGKSAAAAAPGGGHQHPESCQVCSAHTAGAKTILLICSACGGLKGTPTSHTGGSALPAIPAEESADKCPYGGNSSAERRVVLASSAAVDTDALPTQQTNHSSDTRVLKEINGEQATKNKGPEKELASLFADLLGCPSPAGEPGTRSGRLSLYESMASARHVPQIPPVARGPSRDLSSCRGSVIYENCSKCRRESCCPPPRATPATPYRDRNGTAAEAAQPSPRGLAQARPAGEDHPAQVQPVDRVVQNGDLRCEEVKAKSVTDEDKKRKGGDGRGGGEPAYQVMENRGPERTAEPEERSKYELMGSCGQQRPQQETEGGVFVFPPDAAAPDRPPPRGDGVTYVNIPVSPTSKKQLNYMELELQEATGGGARGSAHLAGQRRSSTKYAQIDITATETAHKVGTQHALGREEGLHALEQRRRGLPQ